MAVNRIADGFATIVEKEFEKRSRELMTADLERSDLDENDLYCNPLAHPPVPMNNPTWVLGAYRIPYFNRDGDTLEAMYRDKLFYRPGITEQQLKEAGMGKYKGPSSEAAALAGADARMPYLLPGGRGPIGIICEGEKKAASALNRFNCRVLGIGGCWNWTDGTERRRLHEDIVWWLQHWRFEQVLVLPDPDIATNRQIAQGYSGLSARITALLPESHIRVIGLEQKLDDLLRSDAAFDLQALLNSDDIEDLELSMSVRDLVDAYGLIAKQNAQGIVTIVKNAANISRLLKQHPKWAGQIRYNEDFGLYELYGRPFREKLHDHQITATFNESLHLPDVGQKLVADGIRAVALENSYSPARDDLSQCPKWDKQLRLEHIFGNSRDDTTREIARAFVVGYVKRILQPGCFWRIMVILVGPQGVGKTGMARWLTGDDSRVAIFEHGELDHGDKDVVIRLMRAKIALFDDIDTFDGREKGRLKRLVTQTHTIQRGAYRENDEMFLRSGIMMGTSNHTEIIPDDPTGNTRFAVATLSAPQDFEWLNENRSQILAEAIELMAQGWEPNIDWSNVTSAHKEKSKIQEKLEEYLEAYRQKDKLVLALTIEDAQGRRYLKQKSFWVFYNDGRDYIEKDWERKEFGQRARAMGFYQIGDNNTARGKDGKNIKNAWRFPE